MTAPPPAVQLESLRIGYRAPAGTRWIVEDINLDLPPGELVLLLGPSGGGKSTLVSALLGLDDPFAPQLAVEGNLKLLGENVRGSLPAALAGRVGAVFQDGALIDDLTVRANVALAARELPARGGQGSTASPPLPERVQRALTQVGLSHPPADVAALSGGQRKRVALARAIVGDPEFLVLDEPTAGLDPRSATEIAELIREVHDASENARTTWVITHDLEAFRPVAHRAICIDPRSGTVTSVSIDDLDPALERMAARESIPAGPPPVASTSWPRRALGAIERVLLGLARIPTVTGLAIRRIAPYHLGMVARSVLDHCLSPALFLAIAGATAGGLATTFALDNNPLEGAFRREVLLGTGKVLVSAALPLLVGVLFAARTAAGATARLGGFRRSRVFESLPLLGVEPARFLLTPLVWGAAIGAVVQTGVGIVSGLAASLWVTQLELGVTPFGWASAAFASVEGSDFQWAALKALLGGIATALACYALASSPKRSQADVARATNDALVASTLLVLVIHGALTVVQFA